MDSDTLLKHISPPLDNDLAQSLFNEFLDIERRFVLGDWEPATLNGGQFTEITARIIYHIDSGNLNKRKSVDSCLRYIEDATNNNGHSFPSRRSSLHLCRVIRTIYKLRSQRGAIHIDPDYSANELDSTLIIALSRWIMAEILRIFWQGDIGLIVQVIREIVRYEVPAILVTDGRKLVLRTDCKPEEEILLLLHNSGEQGMTRQEIGSSIPKSSVDVTRALQKLISSDKREVLLRKVDKHYVLTPNGARRVFVELSQKLIIQ